MKKVVYGLFSDHGEGVQHLFHMGVFEDEKAAYEEWENYLNSGDWIEEIEVL